MYCMHCGKELVKEAEFCMNCGKKPLLGQEYCYNCKSTLSDGQEICLNCGVNLIEINSASTESSSDKMSYCRHCGKEVYSNAEICVSCGRRPFIGSDYCQNCGSETTEGQEVCIKCGVGLKSTQSSESIRAEVNSSVMDEYYQDEFQKIKSSNGAYKGKWNWAAFFFSWIWGFTKGLWLLSIISVILIFLLAETIIIPILIWIFFAVRGNYAYYRLVEYDEQFPKNL